MKIQYASDLHLEFAENWRYLREHPLEKAGDILVLAGDIGYIGDENYSLHPFWNQVADQYEQVLVIPGNHEFYKYYDIASLQEGELVPSLLQRDSEIGWSGHDSINALGAYSPAGCLCNRIRGDGFP